MSTTTSRSTARSGVGLAVATLLGLAACSGGSGDVAAGGTTTTLRSAAATSTTSSTGSTVGSATASPVGTWEAAGTPCGFLNRSFSVWAGVLGDEPWGREDEAEQKAALEAAVAQAPEEVRPHLDRLVAIFDPSAPLTRAEEAEVFSSLEAAVAWGADNCPDGAPYWSCPGPRTAFAVVGGAIGPDGEPAPTSTLPRPSGPTPEAALEDGDNGRMDEPEELGRTDAEVLFVQYDEAGRVTHAAVVEAQPDSSWEVAESRLC